MNRRSAALGVAAPLLLLLACAQPVPVPQAGQLRTGRLALSIPDQPAQSFAASFELRGQPQSGDLTLLSPLGSVFAVLRWKPGNATLEAPGRAPQQFDSLDTMIEQATGTQLPVDALFEWLAGRPAAAAGWEVDLSRVQDGRVLARRHTPAPAAELRVLLEH